MNKYILLDVNGTVGTDERPLLEYLENPEDFVWIDKVPSSHTIINPRKN